ncbi:hypothetical protein FACS1894127_6790 [Clostridia bacterium]|nr:hypothetical protein FACS1894127_6790 [Clostridia bacterium]
MARRNETEEQKRKRQLIDEYLKTNPIKDFSDIQEIFKEMMSQVIERGLAGELGVDKRGFGYTAYIPISSMYRLINFRPAISPSLSRNFRSFLTPEQGIVVCQ